MMAVATPVLERKVNTTEERENFETSHVSEMTPAELHNSLIKINYARLLNPELKREDLYEARPVREEVRPYLVENARADSDLFRADSLINRAEERADLAEAETLAMETVEEFEEEENEDLRPTNTTIQYRTIGKKGDAVKEKASSDSRFVIGKREKIIIAVFVSVIVALFMIIIINSAIIANVSGEIVNVQNEITTVRGALAGVNSQIDNIISPENIAQFAQSHGLVK